MERRMAARNEPGTLREYESILILRPDLLDTGVESINNRVRDIIQNLGGKIINLENWGRRKLAYSMKKQSKGIYLYWLYLASPQVVEELGRNLKIMDTVLRSLTVKREENIDPEARPSSLSDESFAAASKVEMEEEEVRSTGPAEMEEARDMSAEEDAGVFPDEDTSDKVVEDAGEEVKIHNEEPEADRDKPDNKDPEQS